MHARAVDRLRLESDLRRAIERGEFVLHYQPIIGVRDGALLGVEALLRWDDPEQGLVPPAEFIPLLEETGLIVPVGQWVLEEACRQARRWRDGFPDRAPLEVCVNVSVRQLAHADFADVVTRAIHRTGIDRSQLCLEITEAALMDDVATAWMGLRKIKSLGVSLAIDDFGTGYSSLSYVRRFALDMLKIDQSFVRGMLENPEDHAIVTAVISMAHALGMSAVAEGVETPEQLAELRTLGCDQAQGYFITRPAPVERIDGLLERGSHWWHTRDGVVMPS
jgi:EAL domain-containing protein (putative c-di-GMP-specific phosphodiesterase class I)